jgi:DHA1 family bicyclomycin/chloramphenicol resistance-like MFS transporter
LILFFVFLSCIGLTYSNAIALGLARFLLNAGRASELLGFLQAGTGAAVSRGIGLLGVQAIIPTLFLAALVAVVIVVVGGTTTGDDIEPIPTRFAEIP